MSTAAIPSVALDSEAPTGGKLRADQLRIVELLRQSVAAAAPGLWVTLAVIIGASFAEASLSAVSVRSGTFSFITPLGYSLDLAGDIALGWLILGIIYAAYFWRRYPERVHATERILLEEPASARRA